MTLRLDRRGTAADVSALTLVMRDWHLTLTPTMLLLRTPSSLHSRSAERHDTCDRGRKERRIDEALGSEDAPVADTCSLAQC